LPGWEANGTHGVHGELNTLLLAMLKYRSLQQEVTWKCLFAIPMDIIPTMSSVNAVETHTTP
jgi:hypothetical protein